MIGDAIAAVVGKIIDRAWPDPAQKAAAAIELQKMVQAGEFKQIDADLQMAQMQTDVNKVEAASASIFTSGWRPHIGWVCGFSLGAHFMYFPLIEWMAELAGHAVKMPPIDFAELMTLVLGMLGLSKMRSDDKRAGVAS